jgi:L-alanine-DL-glutamate epimerase-like enolase superfamily enzyme
MDVFKTRLKVKNGGLALPQDPGHGVLLDEAKVEGFSKDGWR